MGSVSSTSPNLSNLLQTLSAASPELSTMLSGPQMQSALAKASPGDLVQLSDQALELQQVGSMFGNLNGTQSTEFNPAPDSILSALSPNSSTTQSDLLLQALDSSLGIAGTNGARFSSTGSTSTSSSLADQIASSASSFQAQELNALFGATQTVDPFTKTLG